MTEPKRVGRPPRIPGARVRKVTALMVDEEVADVVAAARLLGISACAFIRDNAVGAARDLLEARQAVLDRRQIQVDVAEERRTGLKRRATDRDDEEDV